ncbi:MAG: hypothetical protein H0W08_24615 [Acidobacteria bacterium]|nr:hypothetical protein [Acidobacteriota bacterium]
MTPRDPSHESSFGMSAWSIIGGAVLATVVVAVISSIPDIKRYIRISTM